MQRPILIAVQAALLGGLAATAWMIGTRLFGAAVGRVTVGVMLLNPWLIWVVKNPMSIVLHAFLYTTFCWLIVESLEGTAPRRRLTIFLGLNAGALALVHGTMILTCFVLLAAVGLLHVWKRDFRSAVGTVAACILMLAIIAPWTVRNWMVSGLFLPVVGNAGFSYFAGNAHWGIGDAPAKRGETPWEAALRHGGSDRSVEEVVRFWGVTDPALEKALNRRMIEHVREHPDEFFLKFSLNAVEYYFPLFHRLYLRSLVTDPGSWLRTAKERLRATATTLFHAVLWALCLAGVVSWSRARPKSRAALGLLGLIVVFPLAYFPFLVFVGHSQYVLPTIPLLSVLAAVALTAARLGESDRVLSDRMAFGKG
jgi:4-amino-4-deoxy-L-arabinose transferase-like glycosyltransferase